MVLAGTIPSEVDYHEFYGGLEPGEVLLYSIAAAAKNLRLPPRTVHWWAKGGPREGYKPIISSSPAVLLSFNDLIELFVVKALTRARSVPLQAVRSAVDYAAREMSVERVGLSEDLVTFGSKLLLKRLGETVSISRSGQLALEQVVDAYMQRIDRSEAGLPVKLHPGFATESRVGTSYPISVSPLIAFGAPTITGTGIKTSVVATRVDAGESVAELAEDYGIDPGLVLNALVFENAA